MFSFPFFLFVHLINSFICVRYEPQIASAHSIRSYTKSKKKKKTPKNNGIVAIAKSKIKQTATNCICINSFEKMFSCFFLVVVVSTAANAIKTNRNFMKLPHRVTLLCVHWGRKCYTNRAV